MAIKLNESDDNSPPTKQQQREQPISNLLYYGSFGLINTYDEVDDAREDAAGEDGVLQWDEAPGYMWNFTKALGEGVLEPIIDAIKNVIQGIMFAFMTSIGAMYRMTGHAIWSLVNMAIRSDEEGYIGNMRIDPAYAPATQVYCHGRFGDTNMKFKSPVVGVWNLGSAPIIRVEVLEPLGNYINGTFVEVIADQKAHFSPFSIYEATL